MRTKVAPAVVLMGLLLGACGATSTATSDGPATTQATSTALPSATTSPPVSEPETGPTTEGLEPDPTDGITQEEDQLIPPIPPGTPTLEFSPEGLTIGWRGTGNTDLVGYLVYHRRAPGDSWKLVAEVPPAGDNLGEYFHVIPAASGVAGEYAVAAVDIDGNLSPLSEAVGADR